MVKRNVQDIAMFARRNPALLWQLPVHLARHVAVALRSRRATRHLRRPCAIVPRQWMKWSNRLLRESARWADDRMAAGADNDGSGAPTECGGGAK